MPENKRAIVKTHFAEASARAFRSPSTPSSAVSSRSSSSSGSPVSKMSRLLVLLLAATRSLAGSKHDRMNDGTKRQRARPITFLHITKVAGVSTTREFRARSYKNVAAPRPNFHSPRPRRDLGSNRCRCRASCYLREFHVSTCVAFAFFVGYVNPLRVLPRLVSLRVIIIHPSPLPATHYSRGSEP